MNRKEIKYLLNIYTQIRPSLEKREKKATILIYGRKRTMILTEDHYHLKEFIEVIMKTETNELVISVIRESVLLGKNDLSVVYKLPISESTYYRWKRKFIDKLYALFVCIDTISMEEILQESIAD